MPPHFFTAYVFVAVCFGGALTCLKCVPTSNQHNLLVALPDCWVLATTLNHHMV